MPPYVIATSFAYHFANSQIFFMNLSFTFAKLLKCISKRKQTECLKSKLDQNQLTSTSQIEHLRKQNGSLEAKLDQTQSHAASQIEQLRNRNESLEAKVDQLLKLLKEMKR